MKRSIIKSLCVIAVLTMTAASFMVEGNNNILEPSHQDKILLNKSIDMTLHNYLQAQAADSVILTNWIIMRYPHPGLEKYARHAYSQLKKQPGSFNSNFLRLIKKNHEQTQPLCSVGSNESTMDCMILQSVWCDVAAPPKDLLEKLGGVLKNAISTTSADMASHVLLTLSELQKRGCLKSETRDVLMEQTKKFLVEYMDKNPDSYGEGVAFLLHAGFAGDVKGIWVDNIRKTLQKKIGAKCSSCSSEPHDILLEIYALSQWNALKE